MSARLPEPRSRTVAWGLFAAGIAANFLLSAPALLWLGVPYDAPYGPVIAKLHPGSYLLLAAWFVALASHGNPLGVLIAQPTKAPLLGISLAGMVAVFCWVVYRQGTSGAAYIVQTLWMPAIAVFTLRLLGPARSRQTIVLVMAMLSANAALALLEYFLKARLVPIAAEQVGNEYFRSSAFLGHPLLNANITTALLPAVTLLPLKNGWRAAIALLLLLSVLAFGARSAFIATVLLYGGLGGVALIRRGLRGDYGYTQLTGAVLVAAATAGALALLVVGTGLGDRIFQNLIWDNSASVRTRAWSAFDYLHGTDVWFGIPTGAIESIELRMGLDPKFETIENFWIYAFLQFGAIGYLPFIVGLAGLTAYLFRVATPPLRVGIVLFYLVASTANALTSKTVSLTLLAVVTAASAAARTGPGPAPARAPQRPRRLRARLASLR